MIPYSRQSIDNADCEAVMRAMRADLITQGSFLKEFEENFAEYCGAEYAVAFSNGTTALHAACVAGGLHETGEGIVPAISFAASANCLRYTGASVRFSDVSEGLPLLTAEHVSALATQKTKICIPVHFAGAVCDMPGISEVASAKKILILEDACHAVGSQYRDEEGRLRKVGSCAHSDMTAFSFHPVKNLTTGEGGMITTNRSDLNEKLRRIRHHGIIMNKPNSAKPAWYYEIQELGFNFRLTDIQAALGISQLKKLDSWVNARFEKWQAYEKAFSQMEEIRLLPIPENSKPALHLAVIEVKDSKKRDALFAHLRSDGIGCHVHYIPIYRHPYYKNLMDLDPENYPRAEHYFSTALSIPLYPDLSTQNQSQVVHSIQNFFSRKG